MQIEDILVADKQLAKELLYDMKQHESALAVQEKLRQPVVPDAAQQSSTHIHPGGHRRVTAASSPLPGKLLTSAIGPAENKK